MKTNNWILKNTTSLSGKTVAITGSTGGIGRELCYYLAELGASLILLDRNSEKSMALRENLLARFPELTITHIKLNLEDIDEVKRIANILKGLPIDILIHNAGAYSIPRHKCKTGYNNIFQINFLSPYYLTKELLPLINERGGRIVAVGSIAHTYSKTDKMDIDFSLRKKASLIYGNAKRFLMFSLLELCKGSNALAVTHPGITFTNITAHYPKLIFALIKHPMKIIFMKPKRAALSIIKGIFVSCGANEWIGPKYFNVWGLPKKKTLNTCKKEEVDFIFSTAERLYGLTRGEPVTPQEIN